VLKGIARCSELKARSLCDGGSITPRLRPQQSEVELQFCDDQPLLARCGAKMPLTDAEYRWARLFGGECVPACVGHPITFVLGSRL